MSNITYTPYYREKRGCVELRLRQNRAIIKTIVLDIKITKDQWNARERKIVRHPNHKILNQKIQNRIQELQSEITRAELLGAALTHNRVKDIAEGRKVTTDFYEYVSSRIPERYDNGDTVDDALADMNGLKGYAPRLAFGDITVQWLEKYHRWLAEFQKREGYAANYAWKKLKFIRTWVNDADAPHGGIVLFNPFKKGSGFKMPAYKDPPKEGLAIAECDRIEALLDGEHPVVVKIAAARFLFMCYSGLRISDARRFDPKEHIKEGRLVIDIKKGNAGEVQLQLWDRLERIIGRLQQFPQKSFSDQKLNVWLKVIGELAEITRVRMTTHLGRHTFACLCMDMDIGIETIAELMKHKRLQTTRGYAKTRQAKMDAGMLKLNRLGENSY